MNVNSLSKVICIIKSKIPSQGPLGHFVHHNTLSHYENINFFEAVKIASKEYDANAFMNEEYYWNKYQNRKISEDSLINSIKDFKAKHNIQISNADILELLLPNSQKDIKKRRINLNKDLNKLREQHKEYNKSFYISAIKEDLAVDIDYIISEHIFKFFAIYFDFGSATWNMSSRESGLWKNFCNLYKKKILLNGKYLKLLSENIIRLEGLPIDDVLQIILDELNISNSDYQDYLFEIALRYKGWLGFIKSLENHPELINVESIKPNFIEAITIIVLCEYVAIVRIGASRLQVPRYIKKYKHSAEFIKKILDKTDNSKTQDSAYKSLLKYLSDDNRKEIWHKSFEKTFYEKFLNAYILQNKTWEKIDYKYQVICCLDDREESFRRYLEFDKSCETFGTAGNFNLPIEFKAYFEKKYRAYCPPNIKPKYKVIEKGKIKNKSFFKVFLFFSKLSWLDAVNSKTLVRGTLQSILGGFVKLIPASLGIISPAFIYRIKSEFGKAVNNSITTKISYKKGDVKSGLNYDDMVNVSYEFLKSISIGNNFTDYIFIIGHGSSSLNNPHEAAYDCGACGGSRGGINARLMALILNDSEVRLRLFKEYSLVIPDSTIFIGAYHNTCSDKINFYNEPNNDSKYYNIKKNIINAAQQNAKERCRRFSSVKLHKELNYYYKKTQQRSIDFRQPRPEYCHATNALCIIGPRSYSRNLFLDRRSFLISYDESVDHEYSTICNILNNAVPICAGINLEYFFSYIDNDVYGCSTKLPHNVVSLVGVINGYQSDLQLGLSSQMIEIHQPYRLFVLVICDIDIIKNIIKQESKFMILVENNWISLGVHNTKDNKVYVYDFNEFKEFTAKGNCKNYSNIEQEILNYSNHLDFGQLVI